MSYYFDSYMNRYSDICRELLRSCNYCDPKTYGQMLQEKRHRGSTTPNNKKRRK